jgi:cytochrome c-type biogenesis protein CcmH
MMRIFAALLFLLSFAAPVVALTVDTPLPIAADEARAKALFTELRCMVCSGESVADSPAEVARDVRKTVRHMVLAGKTDEEIKIFFATQYGEKILMMPIFNRTNFLLWVIPFLLLLAGVGVAWVSVFAKGKSK